MKKDIIKPLMITTILVALQTIMYTSFKLLQGNPHLLSSNLDNNLPFINWFILFYVSWYIFLFLMPILYYKKNKELFIKYSLIYIITTLIANITFVIYPTTVIRPQIIDGGLINNLVSLIYSFDLPPLNCFPSLHCALCFIWIVLTFKEKNINKYLKIFIYLMSFCIIASTILIKQHVLIDILGAIVLVFISFCIVYKYPLLTKKFKKIIKILD